MSRELARLDKPIPPLYMAHFVLRTRDLQLELQVDNFESAEELQGFFRSSVFQNNPIGVEFDPDKLLERWESGDPIEELVLQGSA